MLETPPNWRMLAPAVPDCEEVVNPGRICQHWRTDAPFSAQSAVTLRNVGGTKGWVLDAVAICAHGWVWAAGLDYLTGGSRNHGNDGGD